MLDVVRSLAVRYGTPSIAVRRPRPVRGVMPAGSEPSGVSSGVRWGGVAPLLMLSMPAASVTSVASVASVASAASAASVASAATAASGQVKAEQPHESLKNGPSQQREQRRAHTIEALARTA